MAGTSGKRPLSPSKAASGSPKNRKRARVQPKDEAVVLVEDEDDLAAILALIKESEEKEKRGQTSNSVEINDDDDIEDDAAMARRLAAEWGTEPEPVQTNSRTPETVDVDTWEPPAEASSSKAQASPSRTCSSQAYNISPDQSLAQFRSFFTAERNCTNCGKPVKSPRGFVRCFILSA